MEMGWAVEEVKAVVREALDSKRLRVAIIKGSCVLPKFQTELLMFIADKLREGKTRVMCLNIGEFDSASREAYEAVVNALPSTIVGSLYWHDSDSVGGMELKERAKGALRRNQRKAEYKAELLREEVWRYLKHGCKAWHPVRGEVRDRAAREAGVEVDDSCVCGTRRHEPGNDHSFDGNWVQCDRCFKWFHAQCVGFVENTEAKELDQMEHFLCDGCRSFAAEKGWAVEWMRQYASQWEAIRREEEEAVQRARREASQKRIRIQKPDSGEAKKVGQKRRR